MKLHDMHIWFRQYAQQMGMQNVRAILPEQIDLLINTSISDVVNQIIRENLSITNDRIITDNTKLGQINALRTLYKVSEIEIPYMQLVGEGLGDTKILGCFKLNPRNKRIAHFSSEDKTKIPSYLWLNDFSISYITCNKDCFIPENGGEAAYNHAARISGEEEESNWFPVRLIDDNFLSDTLNDFILSPRLRSPIIVVVNDVFELYIDKLVEVTEQVGVENNIPQFAKGFRLNNNLIPYKLRMSYIAKPNEVKYNEDLPGKTETDNIECDLPEALHIDVLKHAVDLWRVATSGALHANQGQQTAQQPATNNAQQ